MAKTTKNKQTNSDTSTAIAKKSNLKIPIIIAVFSIIIVTITIVLINVLKPEHVNASQNYFKNTFEKGAFNFEFNMHSSQESNGYYFDAEGTTLIDFDNNDMLFDIYTVYESYNDYCGNTFPKSSRYVFKNNRIVAINEDSGVFVNDISQEDICNYLQTLNHFSQNKLENSDIEVLISIIDKLADTNISTNLNESSIADLNEFFKKFNEDEYRKNHLGYKKSLNTYSYSPDFDFLIEELYNTLDKVTSDKESLKSDFDKITSKLSNSEFTVKITVKDSIISEVQFEGTLTTESLSGTLKITDCGKAEFDEAEVDDIMNFDENSADSEIEQQMKSLMQLYAERNAKRIYYEVDAYQNDIDNPDKIELEKNTFFYGKTSNGSVDIPEAIRNAIYNYFSSSEFGSEYAFYTGSDGHIIAAWWKKYESDIIGFYHNSGDYEEIEFHNWKTLYDDYISYYGD